MTDTSPPFAERWFKRLVRVEAAALLWSFAYFFCLLCGYYILRPLREKMARYVQEQ